MPVFEEFMLEKVNVGEVELRVRHAGSGPAIVLLHGHPRTHATWHRVAPLLTDTYTVVCPDLRGYGGSSQPNATPDHASYSKRAMASDVVTLMRMLGHEQFAAVGHDRGCYVAFRAAIDHPDVVSHLVVMDGIPIAEALARADARFAQDWWHWFFLGQTANPAERVISADPDAWYQVSAEQMGEEAYADLRRALHDPAVVHAMCEDYRAGLGVDREHDEADRAAGRRVACPTLIMWAERDDMEGLYGDPVSVWCDWASDVRGGVRIDSGHHMAEEAPDQVAASIRLFLAEAAN